MITYPNVDAVKLDNWTVLTNMLTKKTVDNVFYIVENGLSVYIKLQGSNYLDDSDFILVGFSGAVKNKGLESGPFFSFSGISKKLNIPLISFSDPSLMLSSDLTLGWYLGNSHIPDYPLKVSKLLDKISLSLNKKVILCGGSGGGFAALNISNMMINRDNAIALAWNPQVIIKNYYKSAVDRYINSCWDADHDEIRSSTVIHRGAKSLILMDGLDSNHLRLHLREYLKDSKLKHSDKKCFFYEDSAVVVGDWGTGHTAPPKEVIIHYLMQIMNKWSNFEHYQILPTRKKIVDFSDNQEFLELKATVRPKVSIVSNTFLIETELNNDYVGYQLRYKIVDSNGITVMTSPYLTNYHNCRVFGTINSVQKNNDISEWIIVVMLEDYFGNKKNIRRPFAKKAKKYSYMSYAN